VKILIYSANFAPEPVGIGKYSGEMAAWLVGQGHEVRVVAAPPYYPAWQLDRTYTWPPFRRELLDGVDVWRSPLWVPNKPGGFARVVHLLTFAISSFPIMLWQTLWRPKIVMVIAPALVCAPAGCVVAKLVGAKGWLHIQDFEVDVAFEMGLLNNPLLQRMALATERFLLECFDNVSSISLSMLDRLRQKGLMEKKIRLFPNWVDISHIYPLNLPSDYRKELNIENATKVVLYSGTLGAKQGLMIIPEAAQRLAHRKDLIFVVCGEGVIKSQLEAACGGLSNIKFLPLQPFERLGQLLGLADIHLLPQSPEATDLVLPSKLSGMLASGRPVIATSKAKTEISKVVSECGLVVPPEDSFALANAIEQLVNDDKARLFFGFQARRYAEENLARDSVLGKMLEQLNEKI
jgi:colanic acid biosynthesis glycosyl transferase WcaI